MILLLPVLFEEDLVDSHESIEFFVKIIESPTGNLSGGGMDCDTLCVLLFRVLSKYDRISSIR